MTDGAVLTEDEVEPRDKAVGEAAVVETDVAAPSPPTSRREVGWRRVVLIIVAGVGAIVLVGGVFEGPLAREWYRSRQRHLASDLTVARPGIRAGDAIGVVQVPRVGVNAVIAEGDAPQSLRGGPGHRVGTARLGQKGNSVITGHRVGWGGPFGGLADVRKRDLVVVQDRKEQRTVYRVVELREVGATEGGPVARSTDFRLTLITSAGGFRSDRRLVISAVSGPRGRLTTLSPEAVRGSSAGSPLLNRTTLLAIVAVGAAGLLFATLRRRHRVGLVSVVVAPLVALGVLGLALNADLYLPALR